MGTAGRTARGRREGPHGDGGKDRTGSGKDGKGHTSGTNAIIHHYHPTNRNICAVGSSLPTPKATTRVAPVRPSWTRISPYLREDGGANEHLTSGRIPEEHWEHGPRRCTKTASGNFGIAGYTDLSTPVRFEFRKFRYRLTRQREKLGIFFYADACIPDCLCRR